jgi:hypothetical protein
MTETAVKYFTLEEANATIPYVRRIVGDIVAEYHTWRDCIFRYEVIAAESKADEGETEEQAQLRVEVDSIARRINAFIDELTQVGCVFKGFDGGLVDFQARLEGRDIYLCWQLDEPEIRYWHELDAGFAGRQPVTPDFTTDEA